MPTSVSGADAILRDLDQRLANMRHAILERLSRIGEEAVRLQRNSHKYHDQTGNLTSSIGYAVLDKGSVYKRSSFAAVSSNKGTGADGSKTGKDLIDQLAQKYASEDMALVIVAGMEYATYVQDMGLNVIDTAQLHVNGKAPEAIERIVKKVIKGINDSYK